MESIGLALGIILLTLLVIYYANDAIGVSPRAHPDTPRFPGHLPLIGGSFQIWKNYATWHQSLSDALNCKDYKTSVLSIPFFPSNFLINDAKNLEHILKTNFDNYVKGSFFSDRVSDVLGHGIFNADGDLWKSQRKLASNIFSTRVFKSLFETVFAQEMNTLMSVLDRNAVSGTQFDLQDLFFKFTLDSFAQIGFGVSLDTLNKTKVPFAIAFDRTQVKMVYRFFSPTWYLEERLFPTRFFELKNDIKTVRDFGIDIVRQRAGKVIQGTDLLSLFMNSTNEQGEVLSEDELVDHVINFIIAGRDTTAQALSWTMYCLASNPSVLQKLVSEIRETLGESLVPTYEQAKNLKYTNAVFHESLRLFPSVPSQVKMAVNDDILPDGTFIPSGSGVSYFAFASGRNIKLWGHDAGEFRPERWFELKPSQFEYPVFHCGPRVCLGKSLAELEGVFVLVSLLNRYRFDIAKLDQVTYDNSLTLPIRGGLFCSVTKLHKE